ncbi:MAG: DUF2878 domain-containing protein [Desulfuromonadales bacterium]|nr:DUF2878 domain-containing protein [Desulfuromonadales bacterium]
MSTLQTNLLNVGLYQLGWFSCVLGAAWGHPLAGAALAVLLLLAHLYLVVERPAELQLMLAACLIGVGVDSLQQGLGLFTFRPDPAWPFWLPAWVFVIWAQFATLFHYALRWLAGRDLLAALFGLVGGPLAYWGGIRLGAASFGENPPLTLAVLALVWALVTPTLLWLSHTRFTACGLYRLFNNPKNSSQPPADQVTP